MENSIDGRVVRTVRSLRKFQTTIGSFSTRTSTPSNDSQVIDLIASREELNSIRQFLHPTEIFEVVKNDKGIIRDLMLEPVLNESQLRKIQEKVKESDETKKIQQAKQSISTKLQERMDFLRKQLAESSD